MIYRIGTKSELLACSKHFPAPVVKKMQACVQVLDDAYGAERDYMAAGGYCLLAECKEDLIGVYPYLDFETRVSEWAEQIGEYLAAYYLLNDDYGIVLFMPVAIAPENLLDKMRGEQK